MEEVDEGGPNCWTIPVEATIALKDDSEVGRETHKDLHDNLYSKISRHCSMMKLTHNIKMPMRHEECADLSNVFSYCLVPIGD